METRVRSRDTVHDIQDMGNLADAPEAASGVAVSGYMLVPVLWGKRFLPVFLTFVYLFPVRLVSSPCFLSRSVPAAHAFGWVCVYVCVCMYVWCLSNKIFTPLLNP